MSSGRRSAYRAMYAASTASTWSSTTRSPLLRSAVATARRSSAQSASAGASVSRNAGSAAPSPSRWPIRVSSSVRSASRSRPVLFLYFSVRPSRNSATVAGCGYTSIARRLRPERGLMSRPSRAHTLAPRGRSRNSGLPVFDGCAPASNRAKSALRAASAGRFPVAFVTMSGASTATRQSPATNGARASAIWSSVRATETCTSRPPSSRTARPVGLFSPQARSTPTRCTGPSLPHRGRRR